MKLEKLEKRESLHTQECTLGGVTIKIVGADSDLSSVNIGTPETSVRFTRSTGEIRFTESKNLSVRFSPKLLRVDIKCPIELIHGTPALKFLALTLSEHIRQLESKIMTHGASVLSPDGKAVVILGNQGSGKTTLVHRLCSLGGYRMIGNDIIIIGANDTGSLSVYGGTKEVTVRKTAAMSFLHEFSSRFKTSQESNWRNKVNITPHEAGVEVAEDDEYEVSKILWVGMDTTQKDSFFAEKITPSTLVESLLLSEKLARYINGAATPLIGKDAYLTYVQSFDTPKTIKNRMRITKMIYDTGFYALTGGDVDGMTKHIQNEK